MLRPFRHASLALLSGASLVCAVEVPSFRNDVMAALSKAGCNLGTCHGNATGKGGFKLSLRGEDMLADHAALSRDIAGRRVNAFRPEQSLILLKGTNQLAHEGGKRLHPQGWEYQVLRDWIAAGLKSRPPRPSSKSARTGCNCVPAPTSPTAASAMSPPARCMSRCKTAWSKSAQAVT